MRSISTHSLSVLVSIGFCATAFFGAVEPLAAQRPASAFEAGELFERVVTALRRSFHDRDFRAEQLPDLADRYRAAADAAETIDEERGVVHAFLSEIPASHLALYSRKTHSALFAELGGRDRPTLGMQLEQRGGKFFATWIYEGGPADRAGVRRGDRVLAIDGRATPRSDRLGRRSDDAHLPDPPLHALLVEDEDEVRLTIQRKADAEPIEIEVEALPYSGWSGTKASARIIEHNGRRIGYVHLWFIYISGAAKLIERLCEEDFADCDAVILDLRGRGGSAGACDPIARLFAGKKRVWNRPCAALIDAGSRSAKEVIALRFKELREGDDQPRIQLVGEPTAGAVIPASFKVLTREDVLMFPSFVLGRFTKAIEGKPVTPDVEAADELPYAAGADPILEAALHTLTRS